MRTGQAMPPTPRGLSNIDPPPPWHLAGDLLVIEFWARANAVSQYLPPGLEIDPDSPGRAHAFFVDWQFTGRKDEYLQPARYQYREFFVLLDALFRGRSIAFCPYIFVDNDAAMARGWVQGFPMRAAAVFQTRIFAAGGKATPSLTRGARFGATASSAGQRIAAAEVVLGAPTADLSPLAGRPMVHRRHFPRPTKGDHECATVNELIEAVFDELRIADCWRGEGTLVLPECEGEQISDLAPTRCGMGFRASVSYTVQDLRALATF